MFASNAANLLGAAESAAETGGGTQDWSVLIGPTGGIHMIAASDWPLESLQAHHGAVMAFRVRHRDGSVRLEGRAGYRTCLFETAKPNGAARLLLAPLTPASEQHTQDAQNGVAAGKGNLRLSGPFGGADGVLCDLHQPGLA